MRKLFVQLLVSVDGYFDGPNQELDWFIVDDEFLAYVDAMLGSIDGILLGRTTYEGFAAHWPTSTQAEAERMNTLPKFVASRTLSTATWSNTTILAEDVPNAVARMKQESGMDLAIFGSSTLPQAWPRTDSSTSTDSSSPRSSSVAASESSMACPTSST